MKINEVAVDPVMKLRMEIAKLRENDDQQHDLIILLSTRVSQLEKTLTALIKKLGPQ